MFGLDFSLILFFVILVPTYVLIKHFKGRREPLALLVMSVLSILCWLLIGVVLYFLDIDMQETALLVNVLIFFTYFPFLSHLIDKANSLCKT